MVRREVARSFGNAIDENTPLSSGGGVGHVKKPVHNETSSVSETLVFHKCIITFLSPVEKCI